MKLSKLHIAGIIINLLTISLAVVSMLSEPEPYYYGEKAVYRDKYIEGLEDFEGFDADGGFVQLPRRDDAYMGIMVNDIGAIFTTGEHNERD